MKPARNHGIVAFVAALLVTGCIDRLVGGAPGDAPDVVFDTIWRDFDRYYASFDIKHIDWDETGRRYRARAHTASSSAQLAAIVGDMFQELHDPHVLLFVPPRTFYESVPVNAIRTGFDPRTIFPKYVPNSQMSPSRNLRYGRVDAEVGYVWIGTFEGRDWSAELDDILKALDGVKAIILDVRNNGGGVSNTADELAGRFVDVAKTVAWVRYRNGPRHGDLGADKRMDVQPQGVDRFSGHVVLLTNRRVMSAAEHFVLAMRSRPDCVSVGDTTLGAMGNPFIRELANGWQYRVPQWIEYGPTHEVFEGVGIPPTLAVPYTEADAAAARDPQLEVAIQRARVSP